MRSFSTILVLVLCGSLSAQTIDYARDVAPIFDAHCRRCHGEKKQEGGLRVDIRRRMFAGGDTGPAVVAKDAAKSHLIARITETDDDKRMPPSGPPLDAAKVRTLKLWIDQGAAWPDALAGVESYDKHWAYRPIRRPEPPGNGAQHPVDAFVIAKLGNVKPSPAADPATLLRRLHLDLVGLPPTVADLDRFTRDCGSSGNIPSEIVSREVDRLLASPHFGERWGRHWLDLARFAESDGYENDVIRPDAWRFRDWVVAAFNDDMPFDRFTLEQLAGDLLPSPTPSQKIAVGFHRNTLWNTAASGDKEEFRTYAIKDRAETTATAWMGMTLGCAKCHSHKYDPVSQREYYQLYAYFNNTDNDDVAVPGGRALSLRAVKRASHVHVRGNFLEKGAETLPGTPVFLPTLESRAAMSDRLDLARWLLDPAHPLTARVAANRVWQHLFGHGLVTTPDNFGPGGEPPSHPELLDWLATEYRRQGWSTKSLIRTIVMSHTYRQSSARRADVGDPSNRLLARQNRFRVEAEIVRDLALSVSGLMDAQLGGPSIVPPFPEGFLNFQFTAEGLKMPTPKHHRRSLYIHVQRTLGHPFLSAFEAADGNQPCVRRERSTTAVQALTMLNDPVMIECTRALGKRLAALPEATRVHDAFQLCMGRSPTERERTIVEDLVRTQTKLGAGPDAVWFGVARALMNSEGFITRE